MRAKVCGLVRRADAVHAAEAGADFLGVVLVPESPRYVSPGTAEILLRGIGAETVAVVADLSAEQAVDVAARVGASVVQLHGREAPEVVAAVRESGPWSVWKAIGVRGSSDLKRGIDLYGEVSDGLLLDGWDPTLRGGTGRRFAWTDIRRAGALLPPDLLFVVAGGLTPDNVGEAIRVLRPDVVDVSSGVEEQPGMKDRAKVEAFLATVRKCGGGSR